MFRSLLIILLILSAASLFAEPDFYPQTMVGESFNGTWCPGFADAVSGLNVLNNQFNPGEFLSYQYFMQSGDLSNVWADSMAAYYGVSLYPTVIFNGTQAVNGVGDEIADGSAYLDILEPKLFAASPIKIQIGDFITTNNSVEIDAAVIMKSSVFSIQNQSIRFVLIENVSTETPRVVREVNTQPINLTGLNSVANFTADFTISGDQNNYWVVVYVQLDDHSIIQAASTLIQPVYEIRAAFLWSSHIVDQANYNYNSEPVWLFNTGQTENFTIRLLQDDGPTDWYFNYCDEDGSCYPGFLQTPFTLAAGEYMGFHLNLSIGSSGIANCHFEIDSDNIEPYIIPFTYQTSDAAEDDVLPAANVGLLQTYPNPFSGNTTFKLNVKIATTPIEIHIFNAKGQKVRTITTDNLNAGTTFLNWDGTNHQGRSLPQGIYYSKLKGSDNTNALKMLIMNK